MGHFLISLGDDLEPGLRRRSQVNIPGTEEPQGHSLEFRLESIQRTEVVRDIFQQISLRCARGIRCHAGKVKLVVVDPAGILHDGVADVSGDIHFFLEELLECPVFVFRVFFDDLVQVIDVVLLVFGVVDFHGPSIDVGFQCIKLIAQRRELKRIGLQ